MGSSPVAFKYFFSIFSNLLVSLSLFLIVCTTGYVYLNLTCVYVTNTAPWKIKISLFAHWIILSRFVIICWLLNKINFFKKSYRNTIRVSNGLYPDQNRRSVGTDLDPNYLQMIAADKKSVELRLPKRLNTSSSQDDVKYTNHINLK